MKSICFFASYFQGTDLPYYVRVYLHELRKHFSSVVLLATEADLSKESLQFLVNENILFSPQKNEGFDFGLWYKAFQLHESAKYDKIALVNDSCILFKPLDDFMKWSELDKADVQGMTFSDAIAPHLQSYFLVINQAAISATLEYFEKNKVLSDISDVIRIYEVGLCTFLLSRGLKLSSFIDNNGYKGEFSPYYYCIDYHLTNGIPLIKKKILFSSYRKDELFTLARMNFNLSDDHYIDLIKQNNAALILDFDKLKDETRNDFSPLHRLRYEATRLCIRLLRPFYKIFKNA